jgi:acetyl-CoA carboxylase biotin carboxyl carrier protein
MCAREAPVRTESDRTSDANRLITPEMVRALLAQLEGSDVEELDLAWGSAHLHIRRDIGVRLKRSGRSSQLPLAPTKAPERLAIVAPLTGIFYARPSPEEDPFVRVGDPVQVGQVVGLIETMKLFNEVTTDVEGIVDEFAASDGALVEEGETLIYLRPKEEADE